MVLGSFLSGISNFVMNSAPAASISSSIKERESAISPLPADKVIDRRSGDAALAILDEGATRPQFSSEDDAKVLRKIDLWVMPVVLLVYFLQQLDKSSLSYTSVFGIIQETGLVGSQYSWLSSIVYVAQLIWQPISSYLLVRLPVAKYLFVHVLLWGVVVASTAAATDFKGLITTRFFLGIFEATVAPCFITITQMWWRRREQTMRLSMWMAMNGVTGMVGSLLSYGLGHIQGSLRPYQTIFLFIGLLTIVCSPTVLLVLPDSPAKAKFLNHDEKVIALERLRANNQGTESKIWKWEQVWDLCLDPKTYLWFLLLFVCAAPSGGIGAFGPLIIQGFGFNQFHTILFNIPFAAFQVLITIIAALVSTKIKLKWPVVFGLSLPPIAGAVALLVLDRGIDQRNKLLACYYVLSFSTALQPMLYTWTAQNTAGHTKKACTTGVIFVAQCAGNIVGPLLYRTQDKPYYHRGLVSNLICWIVLAVLTLITAAYLAVRNSQHAAIRARLGKETKVVDTSLEKYAGEVIEDEKVARNDQAFYDLTDSRNEDFIFVL
ncbi:hypothetical protein Hypma_003016 [Hypsizygus marmoreus]|uniref:Major facilitator superfamily (MFS) profile domain-containing protein n=1 Tax=Hypsizygus marmoreus TaxID=39966 RepID=A0A369J7C7_HYPMA|nr:hypothetical protein Hypma_003016 [Hypsizygus marmoreus]